MKGTKGLLPPPSLFVNRGPGDTSNITCFEPFIEWPKWYCNNDVGPHKQITEILHNILCSYQPW